MRKTIAITGATGHVGANLVRKLVERGYVVKALMRKSAEALSGVPVEIIHGDLGNPESLKKLCQNAEVVVHAAASISIGAVSTKTIFDVNVTGTQNIINACKATGVSRLIHFSSVDAFKMNGPDDLVDENTPLDLDSKVAYKKTKALGEKLALESATSDMEVLVLSPAAIMGPNDFKPSLIGQMLGQMYNGQLPVIVPGGYHWVDVRDICDVVVSAIEKGKSGEKYLLAGEWVSLAGLAAVIQPLSKHKVLRATIPTWLAYVGVPFVGIQAKLFGSRPLYTFDSLDILRDGSMHMNAAKAAAELGFKPRPIKNTITDTIDWFRQNNFLK